MKFALLSLVATTAVVVTAVPSGERRAIEFGTPVAEIAKRGISWGPGASVGEADPVAKRELEERWSKYNANSAQDPAAKRDLEERWSKYNANSAQDPAAKRDLEERWSKYNAISEQDPAAKRDLEERWIKYNAISEQDPSA